MCYPFTGQSWFFLCCALQDVRGGEKGVQKEDSSSCAGAGAGDLLWWCKWGGCRGALCQICSAQGLLDMAHVHDGLCPYLVLELHPCLLLHVTALTGEKGAGEDCDFLCDVHHVILISVRREQGYLLCTCAAEVGSFWNCRATPSVDKLKLFV